MTIQAKNQSELNTVPNESKSKPNGVTHLNGNSGLADLHIREVSPPKDRADLPTFPLESGWREVYDSETGIVHRSPLTLLDILYPTEDDIGVVFMLQSLFHDFWLSLLRSLFSGYLDAKEWLITSDVLINWHRGSAGPTAPDLAFMRGGRLPAQKEKSYHVGRDGPIPEFVLEITSRDTRDNDLYTKLQSYAAVGVREYLIIDIETPSDEDWRLLGYRLEENNPFYQPIDPDADGGLTFQTIGYRFTCTERTEIAVYDAATGERLLRADEQRERADGAEERARTAEERAKNTESDNQALRAELERLKGQQGQS